MADNKGQSTKKATESQKKVQESQDQVLEITKADIKKMLRQNQIHFDLEKRADELQRTHQFVERFMWWENLKMVFGLGTSLADHFFEFAVFLNGCYMVRWLYGFYNN
eukprot:XP_016663005.1 PREDICTED: uncharacterized protein LOC107884749 [Acyrthosiphon pisum]